MGMNRTWEWAAGGAVLALLAVTGLIYWPGLGGPLLLDDIVNLRRLAHIGPVDDSTSLFRFILSSSETYPARPLSFASFLVNDTGWPLYTPAHKYTNILLHLINGALVCWLALLLGRLTARPPRETACIALTAAALWLLAPLQVSTVLYVIQRMTELSALFVLGGLIVYCHGRRRLNDRPAPALAQMTAGVAVFGLLGFLCKESAILLGLYILVMERALLGAHLPVRDAAVRRWFSLWQWVVLIAPVALAFARLIARGVLASYAHRPFTAFERIASQPRILFDYLQNLLVPIRQGMGVTHDDYVLSTGLLSPATTLIAIVALAALVAAALYLTRKTASLAGFAVLWFVAGHLLESSFLNLEPYFEHRNYLPAFGPLFALSYFAWTTRISPGRYVRIGVVVYLVCFALVTKQNVDVWSSKILMGETWAADHPRSVRAQQIRADVWSQAGRGDEAHQILGEIAAMRPDAMAPQVQYLLSGCRAEPDNIDHYLKLVESRLSAAHFDHALIPTLITIKDSYREACPELSTEELLNLIDRVLDQESVYRRSDAVSDLLYVKATILAEQGEVRNAVSHLYAAFRRRPAYNTGLISTEFLYNLGQYREALKVLDETRAIKLNPWSPDRYRTGELEQWRSRIQDRLDPQR